MSAEYDKQKAIGQQVIATELAKHVGLAAQGQAISEVGKIRERERASRAAADARNATARVTSGAPVFTKCSR